ncbi:MAG: DUF1131 family protein [Deltaproteobacteria bacterium]|nr:DUF1131 family protein [Deltaproteobacteria bacterium]
MGAAPIPVLGPMGELARSIPPPAAAPGGPPQAAAPPAAPAGPSPAVEGEELRIRAERVGPILPSTKVDEPSLARLFPGFTLRRIQLEAEGETYHAYELLREGELMLTVQAEDEQTGSQPIVSVHSPEIPTTAGIRTDDTFEALAAAYKDLLCLRSAEDGAVVYCRSKAQSNISYLFDAQKVSAGPEQQVRPAELTLRRILQIDWVSPGTEEDE